MEEPSRLKKMKTSDVLDKLILVESKMKKKIKDNMI